MCAFCAAIPIIGAVGARAQAKQQQQAEFARTEGRPSRKPIPVGRLTAVAITGLVVGSVVYHTHSGVWF